MEKQRRLQNNQNEKERVPEMSTLTTNALTAVAEGIIIPLQPEELSIQNTQEVLDHIEHIKRAYVSI